jgi:hypothetical protein
MQACAASVATRERFGVQPRAVPLAACRVVPSFDVAVCRIVSRCAQEQMLGAHAWRIIAFMQNLQTVRNLAVL